MTKKDKSEKILKVQDYTAIDYTPPKDIDWDEVFKEIRENQKRLDNEKCSFCGYFTRRNHCKVSYFANVTYNNGLAYHKECWNKYCIWLKGWIRMWAEIGWHAKIDLLMEIYAEGT